jgi:hypothetical protein
MVRATANDVRVSGIAGDRLECASNRPLQLWENCAGGAYSFGGGNTIVAAGTFRHCSGGDQSFGGGYLAEAAGTFLHCTGGRYAFGGFLGHASGNFHECSGDLHAFGGYGGTASGKFTHIYLNWYPNPGPFSVTGLFEHCCIMGKPSLFEAVSGIFPTVSGTNGQPISKARFDFCTFTGGTSLAVMESQTRLDMHYCKHVGGSEYIRNSNSSALEHVHDCFPDDVPDPGPNPDPDDGGYHHT